MSDEKPLTEEDLKAIEHCVKLNEGRDTAVTVDISYLRKFSREVRRLRAGRDAAAREAWERAIAQAFTFPPPWCDRFYLALDEARDEHLKGLGGP